MLVKIRFKFHQRVIKGAIAHAGIGGCSIIIAGLPHGPQCIAGGIAGIMLGFFVALCLRTLTPFPASVQTWVAVMGMVLSSAVGLFFGIYPAFRASQLDPIVALRSE